MLQRVRSTVALRTRWKRLRHKRLLARMAGPKLLEAFADAYPHATIMEIGANDGVKFDHVRPHLISGEWTGVLVEPVPWLFERLQQNYAGVPNVKFVNVAVADLDGSLPFYYMREASQEELESLPDWYQGLGSFSRDTVLRHARNINGLEERIVETQIRVQTVSTICSEHDVDQIDLVVIDTEGYDSEIIKAFPYAEFRPRVFVYEHFHLDEPTRSSTRDHLHAQGYETMEEGLDTFAIDSRVDDALFGRWRELQPAVPGVTKFDEPGAHG